MIRRFYILPLQPWVGDDQIDELIHVLAEADRFIPGLTDSSAGLDRNSRTVVWENNFVDEASYTGPYMVHPYHIGAIDSLVMLDSPECVTQDIFTVRFQTTEPQRIEHGIRRVTLLKMAEGADVSSIDALAEPTTDVVTSQLGADDVGWVSVKGRAWTHIWDQSFTDAASLDRYLHSRDGMATSSLEGIKRLADVEAMKTFTFPVSIRPTADQQPPATPADDGPILYTITVRVAPENADRYIDLAKQYYDRYVTDGGGELIDRRRSVAQSMDEVEIQSTWRLDSLAAYSDLRFMCIPHEQWNIYVREATPLILGGTRRFSRTV